MRRHLRLKQAFTSHRFNERSWAVQLLISASDVVPLMCEMSLLLYDRSDQISLLFDKERKLTVSAVDSSSRVNFTDKSVVTFELGRSDLEHAICFLLAYEHRSLEQSSV